MAKEKNEFLKGIIILILGAAAGAYLVDSFNFSALELKRLCRFELILTLTCIIIYLN